MHGQTNIKFTSAKQAKEFTHKRTPKEEYTKLLQLRVYGITRSVESSASRLPAGNIVGALYHKL